MLYEFIENIHKVNAEPKVFRKTNNHKNTKKTRLVSRIELPRTPDAPGVQRSTAGNTQCPQGAQETPQLPRQKLYTRQHAQKTPHLLNQKLYTHTRNVTN